MEIVACTQTEDHSVVDLEVKLLKILMFAMSGEKGSSRDKPTKRGAGKHKKNKSKHEKRQQKQTRYKGQGR